MKRRALEPAEETTAARVPIVSRLVAFGSLLVVVLVMAWIG